MKVRPHRCHSCLDRVYCAVMSLPIAKLSAILLLSAQMLPLGVPLVCDQVRHEFPANCDQQIHSGRGVVLDVERASLGCVDSALCPTQVTAVPMLGATMLVVTRDGALAGTVPEALRPLAAQSPLPPPPKA